MVTEWKNTVLAIIFSDPSKARKMTDVIARIHLCQLHCKYCLLLFKTTFKYDLLLNRITELCKKKKIAAVKKKKKKKISFGKFER